MYQWYTIGVLLVDVWLTNGRLSVNHDCLSFVPILTSHIIHTPRFVGWLKDFIHNRHLASENLVRGYTTCSILRTMPSNVVATIRGRLERAPGWTVSSSRSLFRMPYLKRDRGQVSEINVVCMILLCTVCVCFHTWFIMINRMVNQWWTNG
jgi:hypothetical protein